ncbi:MAG: hypothetical protein HY222_03490 [Thaumarchaeota archaeon]|nr:hypothetical protein [Nitrososphaerota archaeon]MBI3641439.1 hypothetical protein [Nitrososphaerota archaeon]
MIPDTHSIKKALVTLSIEESLLEIGGTKLFNEALRILYETYHCYLVDCYEHPEYLKIIFNELDRGECSVIIESINEKLQEFSYYKPIDQFLVRINEMKYKLV